MSFQKRCNNVLLYNAKQQNGEWKKRGGGGGGHNASISKEDVNLFHASFWLFCCYAIVPSDDEMIVLHTYVLIGWC